MKNWLRGAVAVFYLLGWTFHVYFGLFNPEVYAAFGRTALIPGYNQFWQTVVMPRITLLALLLAGFEIVVGLALIFKGRWVKLGLSLSLLFNLFLIQMGLSFPALNVFSDLYYNRCPNLFFFAIQIYLLFQSYPASIPQVLREGRDSL